MKRKTIHIKNFKVGSKEPLTLICGPCVIESEELSLRSAETLKKIASRFPIQFIFKSSYDKANRTSVDSFRGPGIEEGLRILQRVQQELELPVVTDVHSPQEATIAGEVVDLIQIPAFLCRQTDLLVAAGKTGKPVQVKKGQFYSPWDMGYMVKKIESTGNTNIMLVDRGACFGYNNLVSDFRAIPAMHMTTGYPVCFDATHSVQLPAVSGVTGGQREFIPILAKAAVAAGADALFMEAHHHPIEAKSDSGSMLNFVELEQLLPTLVQIYSIIQNEGE